MLYVGTICGSTVIIIQPAFNFLANSSMVKALEGSEKQRETFAFVFSRIGCLFSIYFIATLLPEIDIILEVGGAFLGTIINIVIPILFYNRAYSGEQKHLNLDMRAETRYLPPSEGDDEHDGLIGNDSTADPKLAVDEDKRINLRMFNWVLLTIGILMGGLGLYQAINESVRKIKLSKIK